MPLPITVPTTIDAAAHAPSSRLRSVMLYARSRAVAIRYLLRAVLWGRDEADERSDGESRHCADQDIPGPGDRRKEADPQHRRVADDDAADRRGFARPFRQNTQHEDPEESAKG